MLRKKRLLNKYARVISDNDIMDDFSIMLLYVFPEYIAFILGAEVSTNEVLFAFEGRLCWPRAFDVQSIGKTRAGFLS